MNEKNGFALVRKPSSAVEKAVPGAKRILSGMVADTLLLVKKARPLRIVLVDDEQWSREMLEIVIRKRLKDAAVLSFDDGEHAWQELLRTDPDLLITDYILPKLSGEEILKRLLDRKATYPIIVVSGFETTDTLMCVRDCASRGLNIKLLYAPFYLESFVETLETALKIPRATAKDAHAPAKNKERKSLRIVILDDEERVREAHIAMLKCLRPNGVEVLEFEDAADAWQDLSRADPDLFITDIAHPGMTCLEMLTGLAERKVKYPVLVISARLGLELEAEKYPEAAAYIHELKRDRKPNLKVYFLPKPYTFEEFQTVFETALRIPRDAASKNETKPIKSQTKTPKRRGKMLVVAYQDCVSQSLGVIFKDDYDLFLAEEGLMAIELAKQHDIDVVVTEINMPGMSGIELLERLKTLNPDIEVIMVTGAGTNESLRESLRLGASDYINMPFDLATIRAAVSKAMQRRKLESEKTAATENLAKL